MSALADPLWAEVWNEVAHETEERQPSFSPMDYYRSGRASKANPDKEDPRWWAENGPRFVQSWTQWRKASGLRIAEFPGTEGEAVPGIELEVWATGKYSPYDGSELMVKSVIDRVLIHEVEAETFIVDIKTGSMTAPWPLQMALNNLCLKSTFGPEFGATWAGFWSARKGGISPQWFRLDTFTDEMLWDQVAKAKFIRDNQAFLANPNQLCVNACGVKQFCTFAGGVAHPDDPFSMQRVQH